MSWLDKFRDITTDIGDVFASVGSVVVPFASIATSLGGITPGGTGGGFDWSSMLGGSQDAGTQNIVAAQTSPWEDWYKYLYGAVGKIIPNSGSQTNPPNPPISQGAGTCDALEKVPVVGTLWAGFKSLFS